MSELKREEQQDELEKYLEEKAKQAQEVEQEARPLSAYEACVLKESVKVHELIAEAKKEVKDYDLNK